MRFHKKNYAYKVLERQAIYKGTPWSETDNPARRELRWYWPICISEGTWSENLRLITCQDECWELRWYWKSDIISDNLARRVLRWYWILDSGSDNLARRVVRWYWVLDTGSDNLARRGVRWYWGHSLSFHLEQPLVLNQPTYGIWMAFVKIMWNNVELMSFYTSNNHLF